MSLCTPALGEESANEKPGGHRALAHAEPPGRAEKESQVSREFKGKRPGRDFVVREGAGQLHREEANLVTTESKSAT